MPNPLPVLSEIDRLVFSFMSQGLILLNRIGPLNVPPVFLMKPESNSVFL